MSESKSNSPSKHKPTHSGNVALFAGIPVGVSCISAFAMAALAGGTPAEAAYNTKLAGLVSGGIVTALEATLCLCASFSSNWYYNSYSDEWYPESSASDEDLLEGAWKGVGVATLSLVVAGYFGPEYPQETKKVSSAQNQIAIDIQPKKSVYMTENGLVLSVA